MPTDAEALGQELRKARETRGLTLEQAERQTRIRAKYLDALEQGHHYALPSAVQARGFLRNYARFLNLDGDMMVAWFDSAQSGRKRRRQKPVQRPGMDDPTLTSEGRGTMGRRPADPEALIRASQPLSTVEEREQQKRRGNFLGTLLSSGVALVALAALLILGGIGLQSLISQGNKPGTILSAVPGDGSTTRPALVATSPATATVLRPTPLPIPATATQLPTNNSPVGGVSVSLQIVERTWLRVTVDGAVAFIGSPPPNTVQQYQGKEVQVRVANGAGVHAIVNGHDYGILGARGEIKELTFTPDSANPPTSNAPPATANSPGAFNPPDDQPTVQNVITSPGATFSFTSTTSARPHVTASILPTLPPSKTFTVTPPNTATPTISPTASITMTPSQTRIPSVTPTPTFTFTPSITWTPSMTPTPTNTLFILPHDTSTPVGGEIRPK